MGVTFNPFTGRFDFTGAAVIFPKQKSGTILGSNFVGNPKKATVTFGTPYLDATYVITITGQLGRSFTYESKTAAGFVINSNANMALTGEISWDTRVSGETL